MIRPLAALLALALASCGAPADLSRHDGARRIVSLNPCLDAMLVEVAEPETIAALSHHSRDPASSSLPRGQVGRYRTTGGTVEELLALDPDLVLVDTFIGPATRAALERQGIAVAEFGIAESVEESATQVRRLAALVQGGARGEVLARRILASGRPARAGSRPSAVLWQPGGIVAGRGALIAELIERAGFANHAASRGLAQGDYLSLERMLADPPDVLLIAGEQRGQHHPVLSNLSSMYVAQFPPNLLYCGGPTIPRAMAQLRMVHEAATS